jgi:hypothetical protein
MMTNSERSFSLSRRNSGISTSLVLILVVALVGATASVYFVASSNLLSNIGGGNSPSITISSQGSTDTVPISINETVYVSAQGSQITLNLNPSVTIHLDVSSQDCTITVNGGQTYLDDTGQDNIINAQNTVLLSNQDSGQSNTVNP